MAESSNKSIENVICCCRVGSNQALGIAVCDVIPDPDVCHANRRVNNQLEQQKREKKVKEIELKMEEPHANLRKLSSIESSGSSVATWCSFDVGNRSVLLLLFVCICYSTRVAAPLFRRHPILSLFLNAYIDAIIKDLWNQTKIP